VPAGIALILRPLPGLDLEVVVQIHAIMKAIVAQKAGR
jgi:hypothetical protein